MKAQVLEFYNRLNANDKKAQSYITSEVAKVTFYILLKLSYALFVFGTMFTLDSVTLDKQRIVTYVTAPQNIPCFIFLSLLGIIIMVIMKEIREENNFKPKTNKFLDFITDILRIIFYFSALYFVKDFVEGSKDEMLRGSLWIFTFSSLLFLVRKIIKWRYFYGTEQGKKDYRAWVNTTKDKFELFKLMMNIIKNNDSLKDSWTQNEALSK